MVVVLMRKIETISSLGRDSVRDISRRVWGVLRGIKVVEIL